MGLSVGARWKTELIELVRGELAADPRRDAGDARRDRGGALGPDAHRARAAVGEPSALAAGIQSVRNTIAARDAELAHALKRVIETCDTLSERVQIDRIERAALVDAIGRLTDRGLPSAETYVPPAATNGRERGNCGRRHRRPDARRRRPPLLASVDHRHPAGRRDRPRPRPGRTDVPSRPPCRTARVRPDGVEVRCRFGDRWVTGFEVCEVIRLDDATRYRLRRRSDGSVIPTLFDEKDLRFFSTTFVEPATARVTPSAVRAAGEQRADPGRS